MPFISQHTAFGLNTDDDPALMPPGDYRYLENGRVGKSQEGSAGSVENILGMLALESSAIESDIQMRGWKYNKELNEIYLLGHSIGGDSSLYLVKDGVVSKLIENNNLDIPLLRGIWSITIAGDDLIWTTGDGEIMAINLTRAKAGKYDSATHEDMILLRRGPSMAPVVSFKTGSVLTNNLLGKSVYQFAYRYVYHNNQFSVLSPWSKSIYAISDDEDAYISVEIPTGVANSNEDIPNNAIEFEWLVKIDNSTEWQIIASTEPNFASPENPIKYTRQVLGITINNNDAYKLVDAIPRNVEALEFMKNRLFLANYLTGYNQEIATFLFNQAVIGTFRVGTVLDKIGFGYSSSVQLALQFYDKPGRPNGGLRGLHQPLSTPRLPKNDLFQYLFLLDWTINTGSIGGVNIPEWAHSYQILRTDNQKKSFFLQEVYSDAYFLSEDEDGARTWGKDYTQTDGGDSIVWDYLMLDITLLNINQIGYIHSEGDRVEFWLKDKYYDKPIEFVDGKFIAIKAFFIANPYILADRENELFEIYSPTGKEQETTLHETGENFLILNPGQSNRAFSVVSGTMEGGDTYAVVRENGEWAAAGYSKTDPYANDWLHGAPAPIYHSMNPFDDNYAIWTKGLGRASVLYEHPGEVESTVAVRYSEELIPDSKINNINKFNVLDRYDRIGKERTPILKLTKARNVLIANHQRNTTSLYVNEGFVKTVDGGEFLAKSSGVITDDRELAGGYGCVPETIVEFEGRMWWVDPDQGSIVRYTVNGTQSISDKVYKVERLIKNITTQYAKANEDLTNRLEQVPFAGYDPEFKEYFITFPEFFVAIKVDTLVFSEETQRWVGEYDYTGTSRYPDLYMRTNYKALGAHRATIYEFHNAATDYNNFFGSQRKRTITLIANPEAKAMKVWNNVWFTKLELVNGSVDPVVKITNKYGQETFVFVKDFINEEGIWKAGIFFDRNTLNMTPDVGQINGERMRSEWIQLEIESDLTTIDAHVLTQVMWKQSEFTR